MALIVANKIALFKSMARSFWRGMSLLRLVLEASSSLIAFNACDLSMMRFIRAISKEMNPATAPKRNEGAVTWAMTCASCPRHPARRSSPARGPIICPALG